MARAIIASMRLVYMLFLASCARAPRPATVAIAPLPAPAETARAEPVQTALPQKTRSDTVRVDKTVTLAASEWLIIEARDAGQTLHSNSKFHDEEKQTTGRFVMVHFKITNLGKREEMLLERPKIEDDKQREFRPLDMESVYVPAHAKTSGLETLEPSVPKEFWTVIEVPADAKGLAFVVHDFAILGAAQKVQLGL